MDQETKDGIVEVVELLRAHDMGIIYAGRNGYYSMSLDHILARIGLGADEYEARVAGVPLEVYRVWLNFSFELGGYRCRGVTKSGKPCEGSNYLKVPYEARDMLTWSPLGEEWYCHHHKDQATGEETWHDLIE